MCPEDMLLQEMGIEGYLGTPLFASDGKAIGLVGVLSIQPLHPSHDALDILPLGPPWNWSRSGRRKARAFEPFHSTQQAGGGSGLGLPSVQALVDPLGGTLTPDSTPGLGTRFEILLPFPIEA